MERQCRQREKHEARSGEVKRGGERRRERVERRREERKDDKWEKSGHEVEGR